MFRRRITINVTLLLAGLAGIVLVVVTGAGSSRATEAAASEGGVAEITRTLPLPGGRYLEVTALVDTAQADPERVIEELAPGGLAPAEVQANYVLWRKWDAGDIPVPVSYAPDGDLPALSGRAAMQFGINQWNAVAGSSFRFSVGADVGASTMPGPCDDQAGDGINSVRLSDTVSPGVLGVTCVIVDDLQSDLPRALEFDLRLNAAAPWSDASVTPADKYDIRSTMLHELGHGLGLLHSTAGTVMQASLHLGQQVRTPTADDIAGVLALYGNGSTPTGTATATATSTATATPTVTPTKTPTPTPTAPASTHRLTAGMLASDSGPLPY
ncbi:MAG TPA: matrixin family metalloprotease [Tepidiformaceae bacterium]|nr:matrixin family metalloprotease [Tepidiformaceae bacterium]